MYLFKNCEEARPSITRREVGLASYPESIYAKVTDSGELDIHDSANMTPKQALVFGSWITKTFTGEN